MTQYDSPSAGYDRRLRAERGKIAGYFSTTDTYQYDWCDAYKTPPATLNDRNKPHLHDIKTVRHGNTDHALDRQG